MFRSNVCEGKVRVPKIPFRASYTSVREQQLRQGRPGCSTATQGGGRKRGQVEHENHGAEGRGGGGHVPRLNNVANLESKGGGTLRELDVLRVIGSISAAQVGTAERRGLRIQNKKKKKHRIGPGQ